MVKQDQVFAADPLINLPLYTNLIVAGTFIQMSPVAIAVAISVEPMPVAKAPTAP